MKHPVESCSGIYSIITIRGAGTSGRLLDAATVMFRNRVGISIIAHPGLATLKEKTFTAEALRKRRNIAATKGCLTTKRTKEKRRTQRKSCSRNKKTTDNSAKNQNSINGGPGFKNSHFRYS